jgi:hypothetical protein
MIHIAIRSVAGTLLFRSWPEALALWLQLTTRLRFAALALMPDHIHAVLAGLAELAPLAVALRAYALQRNRARGVAGPVFEHEARPRPITDRKHLLRTRRYIHLNPCRDGLVGDPLAWPFSTHRDAVGLCLDPVLAPASDPERFHAWVSADSAAHVAGTRFPAGSAAGDQRPATLDQVVAAVSALTRTPSDRLLVRGRSRDLLIRAARALTEAAPAEIADRLGVHAATVRRHESTLDPSVRLVARVVGDPRFPLLHDRDLRKEPLWQRYRDRD